VATTFDNDYTADENLLKNPERGIYYDEPLEPDNDDYDTSWIVSKWLWLAPWCHEDLVWDRNQPELTSQVLKDYVHGTPAAPGRPAVPRLESARSNGYKILFRPRYDNEKDQGKVSDDCKYLINDVPAFHADSLERQKNHINAVAAMLGDYKDVIAFIQAGYLGNWGEWNWADGYTEDNVPLLYNRTDRSTILDHILLAYAAEGIEQDVELRRPVFAKEVVERWEQNPAIYNNASANVGLHNDCFMSSSYDPNGSNSDSGTYSHFIDFADGRPQNLSLDMLLSSEEDARKWAENWTESSSFGGETCPSKKHPGHERWQFCNTELGMTSSTGDPAKLHLCYLNAERSNTVSQWTDEGCYNEIRLKIGYRFEVRSVEYTKDVWAGGPLFSGGPFSVAVEVENTGWARLHKPRDAKLVLRNVRRRPSWWPWWLPWVASRNYTFLVGPVSRPVSRPVSSWAPGKKTTISVSALTPPPGTYGVWLGIPDPDLKNPDAYPEAKKNYAVKLATKRNDANVFDPDTAENDLGVEITVRRRPPWWEWVPPWGYRRARR
jgi:Domain of unknown function (DUF4832)/Domain of unknown function (DUF4874)